MKYKKLRIKNHAVAGVIEALLMVALVSIIISMIQLIYIPQIMEQREADHMDQVSNQFSYLKSMIDIQIMTESDVPVFSMLTLHSDNLPYFITVPSWGIASIPYADSAYITYGASTPCCDITSIKYEASNHYFISQTYALEGGGIFLSQDDGEQVGVYASVSAVENESDPNKVDVHFDSIPRFIGLAGKNTSANRGICSIRTVYSPPPDSSNTDQDIAEGFFRIYTDYPTAWKKSLENTTDDLVDISLDPSDPPTYVELSPPAGKTKIGLYITECDVYVQIGHGWIKDTT